MKLSNPENMRMADARAINDRGISSLRLMENAAEALACKAFELAGRGGCAFVFCGSGNNGGDGAAAARLLMEKGMTVRTLLTGSREHMTADTLEMEKRLESAGGRLEDLDPALPGLCEELKKADVIVDAIFGTGLNREVTGRAGAAVELINSAGVPVVSADIPSGVDGKSGQIMGCAVKAAATVTFSRAKPGHFVEPGCVMCGELSVADIGIPGDLLAESETAISAVMDGDVLLPRRPELSHKGSYGKLLILGGSVGYTGAPSLCARAAVRSGAGLVHLGVPESIYAITAVKNDEAMPFPLPDEDGKLTEEAAERLPEGMDVLAVGPGMGRSRGTIELTRRLVERAEIPLVIDADGLYALSQDMDVLKKARGPVLLTPHEMEFRRMGGRLEGDRVQNALDFAAEYGCALILKGHRCICAFPDGEAYICTHGNPGMAKGGSGDVLTGMAAAFIGQLPFRQAVIAAAFLHGYAGDLCRDSLGEYSMTAGDIIEVLPQAVKRWIKEH